MSSRRNFVKMVAAGSCFLFPKLTSAKGKISFNSGEKRKPIVIATWNHGLQSNAVSWPILEKGGTALDAVEQGVRVVESDPKGQSVGLGGLPDRDGKVTLDACIMGPNNRCGSVACIEHIENPISVARKVMEETPHIMLVGQGAYEFAISQGFKRTNLLTEESKKQWKKWLETSKYKPIINIENHDTIGALALDSQGNLSGACTTSGMAYKMHGRVGDSPIIGAGLFVDNEVGGACATGLGEEVIRTAGTAIIVELMRQGKSPQEACEEAINRIVEKHSDVKDIQVGFLALNKNGEYGSYAIHRGFNFALTYQGHHNLIPSEYQQQ